MSKNKCQKLQDGLLNVVNSYSTNDIKIALGDSTNNHRTLTVNQVIRYLESRRNVGLKTLGVNLEIAFDLLRTDILTIRDNYRTDAVDINEFFNFFESNVLGVSSEVKTLSRELTSVSL